MSLVAIGCGSTGSADGTHSKPRATSLHWVMGWEAPAVTASGKGFSAQTLRLIITPHTAGAQARAVLSNGFGSQPVTITAATIARRANGPALVPGTVTPLTFAGRRSVTISPRQQVLSDPAAISVVPFHDLAVSLAFSSYTGPPTNHFNGLQTSYYSPVGSGNQTGSIDGSALTQGTASRFFLTGLQVLAPTPETTIVAAGDSITDGGAPGPDTLDKNARWPDLLQHRLLAAGSTLSVVDAGVSGGQVTHSAPAGDPIGGPSLEARLHRDVLSDPSLRGIILSEGINDIGMSRASAAQLIAGLQSIARRAHAQGVPIMVATLTPIGGSIFGNPVAEATRNTVNDWIRSQHLFNGVIDFAKSVEDPSDPARLFPAYDSGDHLHPSANGFAAMAQAINLDTLRHVSGD